MHDTATPNQARIIKMTSYISHLPIEILGTIFIQCAREHYYDTLDSSHLPQHVPSWINVSYVSRRWRNVAIDCPTLWAYPFVASRRWTEEQLSRSKQVPLRVALNYYSPEDHIISFLDAMTDHVERFQELRMVNLAFLTFMNPQFFQKLLSTPAPRLQVLDLSELYIPVGSPTLLFQGNTPALRALKLSSCSVPWYSLTLSGVTTLNLQGVPSLFQQHVVDFLAVLRHMPYLEDLHIEDALASADDFIEGEFDITPKTNLPHLSRLTFNHHLSTAVVLLSSINIPLNAALILGYVINNTDNHTRLLSLLARRFNPQDHPPLARPIFRTAAIVIQSPEAAGLQFITTENRSLSLEDLGHDSLLIAVSLPESRPSDAWCFIIDISATIPFTFVQNLQLVFPSLPLRFWKKILEQFPNLRYIRLQSSTMPDIAHLFSFPSHAHVENEQSSEGSNKKLVPLLEELELNEMTFTEASEDDAPRSPAAQLDSLCDAIATRTEARCKLTLIRCCGDMGEDTYTEDLNMVGSWKDDQFTLILSFDDSESEDDHDVDT